MFVRSVTILDNIKNNSYCTMNNVTKVTYTRRINVVKTNLNAELIKPNKDMELM